MEDFGFKLLAAEGAGALLISSCVHACAHTGRRKKVKGSGLKH